MNFFPGNKADLLCVKQHLPKLEPCTSNKINGTKEGYRISNGVGTRYFVNIIYFATLKLKSGLLVLTNDETSVSKVFLF